MATRWYFRSTTSAVGPTAKASGDTDYFTSVPADKNTPKTMTSDIGAGQTSSTGNYNNAGSARMTMYRMWVSPPLAAQTLTGGQANYKMAVGYQESSALMNLYMRWFVYVWRSGVGKVKNIISNGSDLGVSATEHGTSEVECLYTATGQTGDYSIQAGDRIVVEGWFHLDNTKTAAYDATAYYEGTSAIVSDGAVTSQAGGYFECPQTLLINTVSSSERFIYNIITAITVANYIKKIIYRIKGTTISVNSLVSVTANGGAGFGGEQRSSWYAAGRYWVVYSNGTNLYYTSSLNGATSWSAGTQILAGISRAYKYGIYWEGSYIYIATGNSGDTAIIFKRGTCNIDGTISWEADRTVTSSGEANQTFANVTKDSNGYPWVIFFSSAGIYKPWVCKATATDGSTWGTSTALYTSQTTNGNCPVIHPLSNGKMVALWVDNTTFYLKKYNGSTWDSSPTTIISDSLGKGNNASIVDTPNDNIYILYYDSSSNLHFNTWNYTSGFGTEETLKATMTSAGNISLTKGNNMIHAFYSDNNRYFYCKTRYNGVWGGEIQFYDIGASETGTGCNMWLEVPNSWTDTIGGVLRNITTNYIWSIDWYKRYSLVGVSSLELIYNIIAITLLTVNIILKYNLHEIIYSKLLIWWNIPEMVRIEIKLEYNILNYITTITAFLALIYLIRMPVSIKTLGFKYMLRKMVYGKNYFFKPTTTGYTLHPGFYCNIIQDTTNPDVLYFFVQGTDCDPYAIKWDGHRFSTAVKIGTNPLSGDDHGAPCAVQDDNGYFHVFYGAHTTPNNVLQYAQSTNPNDITSWTDRTSDLSGQIGNYPMSFKNPANGDMYVMFRGVDEIDWWFIKSTNDGSTWNSAVKFYDVSTGTGQTEPDHIYPTTDGLMYIGGHYCWSYIWYAHKHSNSLRCDMGFAYFDMNDDHFYSVNGTDLGTQMTTAETEANCMVKITFPNESGCTHVIDVPGHGFIATCMEKISGTWYTKSWEYSGGSWTNEATILAGQTGDILYTDGIDAYSMLKKSNFSTTGQIFIYKYNWTTHSWSEDSLFYPGWECLGWESGYVMQAVMFESTRNPQDSNTYTTVLLSVVPQTATAQTYSAAKITSSGPKLVRENIDFLTKYHIWNRITSPIKLIWNILAAGISATKNLIIGWAIREWTSEYTVTGDPSGIGTNAWTNPSYAYTDNINNATASMVAKNTTLAGIWTTFGITAPGGSPIITKVEIGTQHFLSTITSIIATMYREISWDGGVTWSPDLNELVESETESLTEVEKWVEVTDETSWTWTKLDDTNLQVRITSHQGNDASAFTMSLDVIYVRVTYKKERLARTYRIYYNLAIANSVSVVKQFVYNIWSGVSQIKKIIYTIRTLLTPNKTTLQYNIKALVSASARSFIYSIYNLVSVSKKLIWNLMNEISATSKYIYNILGMIAVSMTESIVYNIRKTVSETREMVYSIFNYISKTSKLIYNIFNKITTTFKLIYRVLGNLIKTFITSYNIRNLISKPSTWIYNIRNLIFSTKGLFYHIKELVSQTRKFVYIIRGLLSASNKTIIYNINNIVAETRKFVYHIWNKITGIRTLRYMIGGLLLKELRAIYNIWNKVTQNRRFIYNILTSVSAATRKIIYNIRIFVSITRKFVYNIFNRTTKTLKLVYNIIGGLLKTLNINYNIRNSVYQTRKLIYNIWNIISIKFKTIYNIRSLITPVKNKIIYNIKNFVSVIRRLRYNIFNIVIVTRKVVYNIGSALGAILHITYNIFNKVSKKNTIIYTIRNFVSVASRKLIYNIINVVSSIKKFIYNIFNITANSRMIVYNINNFVYAITTIEYKMSGFARKTIRVIYNIIGLTPHEPDPYTVLFNELYTYLDGQTGVGGDWEGFFIYKHKPRITPMFFPCIVMHMERTTENSFFGGEYQETAIITFEIWFKRDYKVILEVPVL